MAVMASRMALKVVNHYEGGAFGPQMFSYCDVGDAGVSTTEELKDVSRNPESNDSRKEQYPRIQPI